MRPRSVFHSREEAEHVSFAIVLVNIVELAGTQQMIFRIPWSEELLLWVGAFRPAPADGQACAPGGGSALAGPKGA